jgi:hypothetical protein
MKEEALHEFYKYVLLPQFGLENVDIVWKNHDEIGPDDDAHYFTIGDKQYVLIFRDYGAYSQAKIKELIALPKDTFKYINPTSATDSPPVYHFSLPTPFKYARNVTGYFTLLKVA